MTAISMRLARTNGELKRTRASGGEKHSVKGEFFPERYSVEIRLRRTVTYSNAKSKNCLKPANDTYIRLQYSNWVNGKEGRIGSLSFVKCFGWLLLRIARPFWPLLNWTVRSFIFSIRLSERIVSVSVFCAFSVLVCRRDVKDPLARCK